jgi:outer membrane receptor protein involved in Fe transport
MIRRALVVVLGFLGLCLPLAAQQTDFETITLDRLQLTGALDTASALSLYQPDTFTRSGNSILIHGFPTLTLLDGRRFFISDSPSRLAPADVLPLAFLSSVDVQKINASPMYGTNAPGGVVNMRSRSFSGGGEFGLFYGKSDGKFGYEEKQAYIIGGVGNDKVQITAGASYEESSGNGNVLRPRR